VPAANLKTRRERRSPASEQHDQSSVGTGGSTRAVNTNQCSASKRYKSQTFCPVTRRTNARPGANFVCASATPGNEDALLSASMVEKTARYTAVFG
jgi:hypothetical protein